MTSMPASRNARAMTLAPRSWPSRPGLAISTRIFFSVTAASLPLLVNLWLGELDPKGFEELFQQEVESFRVVDEKGVADIVHYHELRIGDAFVEVFVEGQPGAAGRDDQGRLVNLGERRAVVGGDHPQEQGRACVGRGSERSLDDALEVGFVRLDRGVHVHEADEAVSGLLAVALEAGGELEEAGSVHRVVVAPGNAVDEH